MLALFLCIELLQFTLTHCIMDTKNHFEIIKLTKTERYLIIFLPIIYVAYSIIKQAIAFINYPTEL